MTAMMTEEFAYTSDKMTLQKLQCPMGKVGCPLCYEIVERWNAKGHLPNQFDAFCNDVEKTWKAHYQTLTGKLYDELRGGLCWREGDGPPGLQPADLQPRDGVRRILLACSSSTRRCDLTARGSRGKT